MPDPTRLKAKDLPVTFGDYRLEAVLGQGGMGKVFKAVFFGKKGFQKECALKVMNVQGEDLEKRFMKEAQKGADLRHNNIVSTQNFGVCEGVPQSQRHSSRSDRQRL